MKRQPHSSTSDSSPSLEQIPASWANPKRVAVTTTSTPSSDTEIWAFIGGLRASTPNAKVSDGSQPPLTFDLSLSETAGSRSLDRLVR